MPPPRASASRLEECAAWPDRCRGVQAAPGDRLSWNLETLSTGGWRAGLAYDLGDSTEWYKCCYYRM